MVGISGRSKACKNCRRRRVKCDETRPHCLACKRLTLDCEGYSPQFLFVDERPAVLARASANRPTPPPNSTDGAQRHLVVHQSRSPGLRHSASRSPSSWAVRPAEISEDLFIAFTQSRLFAGADLENPWMWELLGRDPSSSSYHAVRAVVATFFGNINRRVDICEKGSISYGRALRCLNQELEDPERAWSEDVLKSMMTLCIYEMLAFTSNSGWLKHAGGLGRFIQLRGPWRHRQESERSIFESSRFMILLEALMARKRTFLEEEIWKTVPWELNPSSKTQLSLLHDIFCDLPGLLETAEKLKSCPGNESKLQGLQALYKDIVEHIRETFVWRIAWEDANPGACHQVDPNQQAASNLGSENVQDVFLQVYHFRDLGAANEITLYTTMVLMLVRMGLLLMGGVFSVAAPASTLPAAVRSNPLLLPGDDFSPYDLAIEICKCVEYHLLDIHDGAGSFFLLFPARIAYQTLPEGSKESKWLENILNQIADSNGFEVSRGLHK